MWLRVRVSALTVTAEAGAVLWLVARAEYLARYPGWLPPSTRSVDCSTDTGRLGLVLALAKLYIIKGIQQLY
jgi:hypothetical protein